MLSNNPRSLVAFLQLEWSMDIADVKKESMLDVVKWSVKFGWSAERSSRHESLVPCDWRFPWGKLPVWDIHKWTRTFMRWCACVSALHECACVSALPWVCLCECASISLPVWVRLHECACKCFMHATTFVVCACVASECGHSHVSAYSLLKQWACALVCECLRVWPFACLCLCVHVSECLLLHICDWV